jgi:hypothetical protein
MLQNGELANVSREDDGHTEHADRWGCPDATPEAVTVRNGRYEG